jgi:hypothetical protein
VGIPVGLTIFIIVILNIFIADLSIVFFISTVGPVWFHVVRPNQDGMIQIKIPVINGTPCSSPYLLTG